jgi:replicative DNA helicase
MTLPNAKESEKALLGAILIRPTILDEIALDAEDFFDYFHQEIYRSMRLIGSDSLDIVVLSEAMERQDADTLYLLSLLNECPSSLNYETYVQIIKDTAVRRRVISNAEELAKAAFDENRNIDDAISLSVSQLVQSAKPVSGAQHISHYLNQLYEQADKRAQNPKFIYGLETGLSDFDKITRGFQAGEQFILAGSPGSGKSLLAFQLGCGMAERGYPGAVYELEMSAIAVIRRKVSALSKITTRDILSGTGMNERWEDFVKAIEKMEQLPIFLTPESSLTTIQLRADLSRLKHQHGIRWYIVDYMDLLSDVHGSNEVEKSAYISRQLHNISKDLDLAGLAIQSVNKQGFARSVPSIANVSGSGKVAHDADQVAILTRGTPDNPEELNTFTLTWEKMREDEGNRSMRLVKLPGFPAFECYQAEEASLAYWQK